MSKQAKTYGLLALVLMIWGVIGFKVVNTLSPDPELPSVQEQVFDAPKTRIKKDTFRLYANYRDPFLGTLPKSQKKAVKKVVKKIEKPKKNIVYDGMVSQSGSGSALFFVTIDGQQHIMSLKQEVEGVRLLKGSAQRVRVRYDGNSQTITLTE